MTVMQVSSISLLDIGPVSYSNAGVYCCVAIAEFTGMMFNATDETTLFGKKTHYHDLIVLFFPHTQ